MTALAAAHFVGKPCKHGHTLRYVKTRECVDCHKASVARYLAKPGKRELCRAAVDRWEAKNPERARAANSDWVKRNPEKRRAIMRRFNERHKEKRLSARKAWRANNLERDRATYADWRARNKHVKRAHDSMRHARKRTATPTWGQDGIADLYKHAKANNLSVDHVIPLKHAMICGLHVIDNLQLMPLEENLRKNNQFEPFAVFAGEG